MKTEGRNHRDFTEKGHFESRRLVHCWYKTKGVIVYDHKDHLLRNWRKVLIMPDETLKIKEIQELNKNIDKILYEIELEFVHEKEQFY